MQQSNIIFAAIFIAFIVFITMRGELAQYLTLLRGGGTSAATGGSGSTASNINNFLNPGSSGSGGFAPLAPLENLGTTTEGFLNLNDSPLPNEGITF